MNPTFSAAGCKQKTRELCPKADSYAPPSKKLCLGCRLQGGTLVPNQKLQSITVTHATYFIL